jgi:hypothetical protein
MVCVLAIDLEQELAVGVRRRGCLADPFARAKRYRLPALVGDLAGQFLVDIQGQHRNPVQARELEQGQIQFWRRVPDLLPLRLGQKLLDAQFAGHPAIEYRLQPAREHFEADDHFRAQRMQSGEHLQLPLVVVRIIMLFSEQQHLAADQFGQDLRLADCPRLLILEDYPAGRRQTGLGRGFRAARCAILGDLGTEQGAAERSKQQQRELRAGKGPGRKAGRGRWRHGWWLCGGCCSAKQALVGTRPDEASLSLQPQFELQRHHRTESVLFGRLPFPSGQVHTAVASRCHAAAKAAGKRRKLLSSGHRNQLG